MASRTEKLSFERRATQATRSPAPPVSHNPRRILCMQHRKITFTICLGLAVMLVSSTALAQYQRKNLVSNQFATAKHTDPLSVNAWGLVYPPGGPFWIADEGSGWSTLYDGQGVKKSLEVL